MPLFCIIRAEPHRRDLHKVPWSPGMAEFKKNNGLPRNAKRCTKGKAPAQPVMAPARLPAPKQPKQSPRGCSLGSINATAIKNKRQMTAANKKLTEEGLGSSMAWLWET